MRKTIVLLLFVLPSFLGKAQKAGQECFPERDENLLVYDVADVIDDAAEQQLNQLLSNFSLNTSNQIVVVVVPDLCGMDRAQYAIELGEAWGVGQEKEDNGVVVLVKPKTPDENGKAFIAVGRGLTAAIPAATAFDIVNNEMIPVFKQGDYAGGINAGVRVLMDLATGAYNHQMYKDQYSHKKKGAGIGIIFAIVVLVIVLIVQGRRVRKYARTNSLNFWTAWWLLNSMNNSHRGFWNDFSRGKGGFGGWGGGGGGGGFGGFGGGSFGGDGAGGSW